MRVPSVLFIALAGVIGDMRVASVIGASDIGEITVASFFRASDLGVFLTFTSSLSSSSSMLLCVLFIFFVSIVVGLSLASDCDDGMQMTKILQLTSLGPHEAWAVRAAQAAADQHTKTRAGTGWAFTLDISN